MKKASKLKRVKVITPKGERTLLYKPVNDIPTENVICETACPYGKLCEKLEDPRHPEDPNFRFTDFCGELGIKDIDDGVNSEENDEEISLIEMVPVEGTIEKNLSDFPDIYQQLIAKDPVVKLSEIIEKFCSNWCDSYNKEHTNCKYENKLCMMHDLFKNDKLVSDE